MLQPLVLDCEIRLSELIKADSSLLTPGTWIGGFSGEDTSLPDFVLRTTADWCPRSLTDRASLHNPPAHTPTFAVGSRSKLLIQDSGLVTILRLQDWRGAFKRIWVAQVEKKKTKKEEHFYYFGVIGKLDGFDPACWFWRGGTPLMQYSAQKEREFLFSGQELHKPIAEKWRQEGSPTCALDWKDVWKKIRAKKEAAFIWSLWHQAVATNSWRGKFITGIDQNCQLCNASCPETYTHCFFECQHAKITWNYCFLLIHFLQKGLRNLSPPQAFSF